MIAPIVYLLCALTSVMCAFLLLISYRKSGVKLLSWSGACFACLGLSNVVLFFDFTVVPDHDLTLYRTIPALAGVVILLWGFIWDTA